MMDSHLDLSLTVASSKTTGLDVSDISCEWGWNSPPASILELAHQCKRAQELKTGELLIEEGLIDSDQCKQLLLTKPADTRTLTWFVQREPKIAPHYDRILALQAKVPYYGDLSDLSIHECMYEASVKKRADSIDAAVMKIQDSTPVLVFSTWIAYLSFSSAGRAEVNSDPIVKALGGIPRLAVGARDSVSSTIQAILEATKAGSSIEAENLWVAASAENQDKPANRLVTRLIDHAVNVGATDIALQPQRNGEFLVQIRKFNEMIFADPIGQRINADDSASILQLLQSKSRANPTNTQQRLPTYGHISYKSSTSGDVFLRLGFIPLNHLGEIRGLASVSIRLLPRSVVNISLDKLGLDPVVIEQIRFAVRLSSGLIVVVGPTNSGKSTTVAGAIGEHVIIFGDRRRRVAVEDPVERFLPGITQFNIPTHIERSKAFEAVLRAFKRHDPDLVWVGEVQDSVTAEICSDQASTGHLALSTLHASNTIQGFDHMAKLLPPDKRFQFVESCNLFIAQRLVPKLCAKCRQIRQITSEESAAFGQYFEMIGDKEPIPAELAHKNPDGCEFCAHQGYTGVVPVNEVLLLTRDAKRVARQVIEGTCDGKELEKFRKLTMLQSLMKRIGSFQTSMDAIYD